MIRIPAGDSGTAGRSATGATRCGRNSPRETSARSRTSRAASAFWQRARLSTRRRRLEWRVVTMGSVRQPVRRARRQGPAPRAARGATAQDFAFHGVPTANKLSKLRDHEPGPASAGTIRAKRARAVPATAPASARCPGDNAEPATAALPATAVVQATAALPATAVAATAVLRRRLRCRSRAVLSPVEGRVLL